MFISLIGAVLLSSVLCANQTSDKNFTKNFIYDTYHYNSTINVFVNRTTEQIMEFFKGTEKGYYPTRVQVSTHDNISVDNPVFITATQQKSVQSWELPLQVQTNGGPLLLNDMERTLCPHDAGPDIQTESRPTLHVTTSSATNVTLDITLRRVKDFYVDLNTEVPLNVTPSTPKYYFFSFNRPWNATEQDNGSHLGFPKLNYTAPKSVILIIDSDDDICATVSIQNNSCPVFDSEMEVLYKGYYLTMSSKGGITLTQSMFPNGFYIVFIVKESDDACTSSVDVTPVKANRRREKSIRFRVIATVSYREYLVGALVTVAVVALIALFVLVAVPVFRCKFTEEITVIEEEPIIQPSTSGTNVQPPPSADPRGVDDDSDCEVDQWSRSHPLTVQKLTQATPASLARGSDRYFWGALTLAVVYALPVVQLLVTYQKMVFQTGNQDLCYYNFLCSHPLGLLADFNHVYSNVGYILLGGVFMLQVRCRQLRSRKQPQNMGIPQHFGLLYSMGVGLVMEGVLSACYHLCPNKMNFQFDSSFMYVIAVLVMIKLYQNRHSDIIPSAHTTFMIIAFVIALGLFGILTPSVYFSVLFTILYLSTCVILTFKIYYAGNFKLESWWGRGLVGVLRAEGRRALLPAHRARAALLALANVANFSFAIYTAYEHNKDFARQLLAILMGNAILYTISYLVMKLVHRERIPLYCWVYVVLAHLAWAGALRMFINGNTRWSETPAQSRRLNGECSSLQIFDNHDVWHITSAAAMFLSFNMLLTVDDSVANTPRHLLHTF